MNVSDSVRKSNCTGCTACMASCPVDAITMQHDDEGFLYPVVDTQKCVDCSLCAKKCPALSDNKRNTENPDCYSAWCNDKEL